MCLITQEHHPSFMLQRCWPAPLQHAAEDPTLGLSEHQHLFVCHNEPEWCSAELTPPPEPNSLFIEAL